MIISRDWGLLGSTSLGCQVRKVGAAFMKWAMPRDFRVRQVRWWRGLIPLALSSFSPPWLLGSDRPVACGIEWTRTMVGFLFPFCVPPFYSIRIIRTSNKAHSLKSPWYSLVFFFEIPLVIPMVGGDFDLGGEPSWSRRQHFPRWNTVRDCSPLSRRPSGSGRWTGEPFNERPWQTAKPPWSGIVYACLCHPCLVIVGMVCNWVLPHLDPFSHLGSQWGPTCKRWPPHWPLPFFWGSSTWDFVKSSLTIDRRSSKAMRPPSCTETLGGVSVAFHPRFGWSHLTSSAWVSGC